MTADGSTHRPDHPDPSPGSSSLDFSTVVQQRRWVADGEVTARELVEHSLNRIARCDRHLNAFAHVLADEARATADRLDADCQARRPLGPLHGVPIAIKDENDVAGLPTAYGGGSVQTPAQADSELVRRLREAGAIIIGKTRMPEFGIWPFTESAANGWTRNPWDPGRSPAGSSGGTAAAVASGMVAAGIGGDGGGSIRLPSSWCGLFGLKPQRGRVPTAPNPDLWRALGTLGPLTRTVADSALIYDVISGAAETDRFRADPLESTFAEAAALPPRRLRILLSTRNPMGGSVADDATTVALRGLADRLRTAGHTVIDDDGSVNTVRYPKLAVPFQIQVATGVAEEAARVEYPELLEARTRRMASAGRLARHVVGRAERSADKTAKRFLAELFSRCDVLLTPTTPTTAMPVGQLDRHGTVGLTRLASDVASYTAAWNVLGNPAAAVPIGFDAAGLPQSAQLVGPTGGEPLLISLAAEIEGLHPDPDRRPQIR
ncbi:amidase [Gordonia desulfuricans]|uniref:amidase n=1 Tax=Gordonia desulfuricans TaxID=89051 RepID=A0A7K3LRI9_9ACTN|nr:amidase [Gordonia desulfuricans]NDK90863.1 amidase [Gordonia desulfuricans]